MISNDLAAVRDRMGHASIDTTSGYAAANAAIAGQTLVEFLSARLTEEAAAARQCAEVFAPPWDLSDRGHSAQVVADEPTFLVVAELDQDAAPAAGWLGDRLAHIARHDPARVLADVDARRRMIDLLTYSSTGRRSPVGRDQERILRLMASVYAGHDDYLDEWRP